MTGLLNNPYPAMNGPVASYGVSEFRILKTEEGQTTLM
jgi:hypothetical protein